MVVTWRYSVILSLSLYFLPCFISSHVSVVSILTSSWSICPLYPPWQYDLFIFPSVLTLSNPHFLASKIFCLHLLPRKYTWLLDGRYVCIPFLLKKTRFYLHMSKNGHFLPYSADSQIWKGEDLLLTHWKNISD